MPKICLVDLMFLCFCFVSKKMNYFGQSVSVLILGRRSNDHLKMKFVLHYLNFYNFATFDANKVDTLCERSISGVGMRKIKDRQINENLKRYN